MYGVRGVGRLAIAICLFLAVGCGEDETRPGGRAGSGGNEPPIVCETQVDCPSEKPHCDDGICVACRNSDDCGPAAPLCRDGSCVSGACVQDDDCGGETPRCDRDAGICVRCVDDGDCNGGRCSDSRRCVACLEDADCPGGQACTTDHVCAPSGICENHTDCGSNELCVTSENSPVGRCGPICNLEHREAACEPGKKCAFLGFTDEGPLGACIVPVGGAAEQESCVTQTCDTGLLCVTYNQEGTDQRCTSACEADVPDSCGRGFECISIPVNDPPGASVGLCIPDNPRCETDADCREDEVCNIALAEEGGLVRICTRKEGVKAGGEACSVHAECASGFCLSGLGICFGVCDRPSDCAGQSTCVEVTFTLDDEGDSDTVPACFPSCVSNASCKTDQACIYTHSYRNDELVNICTSRAGTRAPGEPCQFSFDCMTGTCNSDWGICEGLCGSDLDCSGNTQCTRVARRVDSGPDGLWSTQDDTYQYLPLCRGMECERDSECGGWKCVPEVDHRDSTGNSVAMRCTPPKGALAAGVACSADSQCGTGRCFDPRIGREDCFDGIDNDGDGRIDCADPLCATACFTEIDCGNGIDDDGDGAIDCADSDCFWDCFWGEANCHDGIDNDGNGLVDCEDPECKFACGLFERNCNNGRDDDGDGLVDCQDPDCRGTAACSGVRVEGRSDAECADGIDNDGDGLIDCADPGCADREPCLEVSCPAGNCCSDGIDNDGNGLIDCFDRSCSEDPACNEVLCGSGDCCTDGIDNDGNGAVDCADFSCSSHSACVERDCRDGVDNDGDGLVDCADPDCIGTAACGETNCTDGVDNDGDGLTDCADPDCWERSHCAARMCFGSCATDADCGSGLVCVEGIHPVRMTWEGRWEYVPACVPASFRTSSSLVSSD